MLSKAVKNGIITNSAIRLANIFAICCFIDSENCTGILKKNKKWQLHQQIIFVIFLSRRKRIKNKCG